MNKDIIQHQFIKESFDRFTKISSEEDEKAFEKKLLDDFNNLSEAEQDEVQQAWIDDMARIKERLDAIAEKLGMEKRYIKPLTLPKKHPVSNEL